MDISQVEVNARTWDDLGSLQSLLEFFGTVLFEVPEEELDLEAPVEELSRVWLSLESSGLYQEALLY